VKASPEAQLRLLELADIDAELGRIEHRRRGLPEHAALARLEARDGELRDSIAALTAQNSDLKREQAKAEADVDQVRARAARDRRMQESGSASAKELSGLQSELESLARRQSDLEDVVLDVMERVEAADARTIELTKQRAAAESDRDRVAAALAAERAGLDKDAAFATSQRDLLAAQIPADLITLYEKIRAQYGGIGAAAIRQRRCEGCRLELDISEINAIKAAAPDAVLRHDACGRILVRTAESGL